MKRLFAILMLSSLSTQAQTITTETFGSGANQFQIDFVTIGNPGNAADTTGSPNPVGSVGYIYNLGKYEISREMIEKANASNGLGLSMLNLFNGNTPNKPATGISWNEAARFVNWLNTSKGYQAAYNFTTVGANDNIALWNAGQYSGSNQYRHKDAYYFLPSVDEWYKGAYGSPNGIWYDYPTGSNVAPAVVSEGIAEGTAVHADGPVPGTNPADINNAGGLSAWGTMAQGGNVWEWNESALDGNNNSSTELREIRGGSFFYNSLSLLASTRIHSSPTDENVSLAIGFRVASVPEPSSLSLLLAGGAVLMAGRRRDRD